MNKSKKNFIIFISILVMVTVLLPFLINFIFGFIIPILPGTMYVGTNESWVIFIGGFLGASVTLIGVYWQLEKTKEDRGNELKSNTKATYELLNNEIDNIIYYFKKIFRTETLYKKNEAYQNKYFLKNISKEMKNSKQYFLLNSQEIYSYINLSTPSEKVKLLKLTNEISILIEEIKYLLEKALEDDDPQTLRFYLEDVRLKDKILKNLTNFKESLNV